jgi:hypothetical protein
MNIMSKRLGGSAPTRSGRRSGTPKSAKITPWITVHARPAPGETSDGRRIAQAPQRRRAEQRACVRLAPRAAS